MFVITGNRPDRKGKSYWAGGSFGAFPMAIVYRTREIADDASIDCRDLPSHYFPYDIEEVNEIFSTHVIVPCLNVEDNNNDGREDKYLLEQPNG